MGLLSRHSAGARPAASGSSTRGGHRMSLSRRVLICLAALLQTVPVIVCAAQAAPPLPGELAWTIGYDPKTFDPAKVDEEESETVRYLTAGVLIRFNRQTQKLEPELAQ